MLYATTMCPQKYGAARHRHKRSYDGDVTGSKHVLTKLVKMRICSLCIDGVEHALSL